MIVLGIDPGTAALGYGIVDRNGGGLRAIDFGCLTTSADLPLPERLVQIHDLVAELIETHHPAIVAVERLFFSKNVQTAFAVGQARGVVLLAAAQAGVPVREATPNEVKIGVTGYGAAEKDQVARMVAVDPRPSRGADARRHRRRARDRDLLRERRADRGPPQRARRQRPGSWIAPRSRRSPAARPPTSGPSARRSAARRRPPARAPVGVSPRPAR